MYFLIQTNKAHTDAKRKRKKKRKTINIIIMKQIKTIQNMYSYKYDNNVNVYFRIML